MYEYNNIHPLGTCTYDCVTLKGNGDHTSSMYIIVTYKSMYLLLCVQMYIHYVAYATPNIMYMYVHMCAFPKENILVHAYGTASVI